VPVILLGIIFSFLERETKSSRKSTRIETWWIETWWIETWWIETWWTEARRVTRHLSTYWIVVALEWIAWGIEIVDVNGRSTRKKRGGNRIWNQEEEEVIINYFELWDFKLLRSNSKRVEYSIWAGKPND
jgi:hypothetical protein